MKHLFVKMSNLDEYEKNIILYSAYHHAEANELTNELFMRIVSGVVESKEEISSVTRAEVSE